MIYVFYPSKIMGGAEYLMIRTAILLKNNGVDVGLIDVENGWISRNIDGINKIFIKDKKIKLKDTDILITTANFIYKLDVFFERSDAKVLLWNIQSYNLIINFPKFFRGNYFLKKIENIYLNYKEPIHKKNLELIIKKNGIVSMDGECDKTLFHRYQINFKNFLPIFINDEKFKLHELATEDKNTIRIIWLGRIDLDFKIHILKKVLLDINYLRKYFDEKIIFNIIGDGPGLDSLVEFCKKEVKFEVEFLGEREGNDLNYILSQSDIGFAMGTSALDLAAKKIPTVLLDFSYKEVTDYNYKWIFETSHYILGRDISLLSKSEIVSMKSMSTIFFELRKDKNTLSNQCFDYVYENHSSTSIWSQLKEYIFDTQFTLNNVYEYRATKPFWKKFSYLLRK